MTIQVEHPDLGQYLSGLAPDSLSRVGVVSFTQWPFALAALAETAIELRRLGSDVTLALWSSNTPMPDTGWSTHHGVARLFGSRTADDALKMALLDWGFAQTAFTKPPLRKWGVPECVRVKIPLNRSAIRSLTYRGSPMGRAMLQVRPDTETPTTDTYLWPQRLLDAAAGSFAWAYDQTTELIRQKSLTCLIVYNGRFLHDRAVSAAGQAAGIKVLYFDKGGTDTDFDLTDNITHDWSDLQRRMLKLYEEWPAESRDDISESWFTERRAHVAEDNSLFVEAQRVGRGISKPDSDVVVVYFSSSGDEIAELELDWEKFIGDQPTALGILAREVRRRPGWALVVRSHPHKRMKPRQDVREWYECLELVRPDVHVDEYSPIDSHTLMRQADIVVTYGSTTGVEAAYAGKPVIVLGPSAYDELGCAVFAGTEEELSAALDSAEPGSKAGALAYGLMMRRRGFVLRNVRREGSKYLLNDQEIGESNIVARHASHAIHRLARWRLEGRSLTTEQRTYEN